MLFRSIKGYEQRYGIDYDETFAPVAKLTTFRSLMALAATLDWEIDHLDVKRSMFAAVS